MDTLGLERLPYDSLNLTKLDVLDDLDEIKIGVAYKHNGSLLESFPADLNILGEVEVVYETVPGWKKDITKCRYFGELPEKAQNYVKRIEDILGVKIEFIGVGAGREAMIHIK
jgi:adenylosuccinate synthase